MSWIYNLLQNIVGVANVAYGYEIGWRGRKQQQNEVTESRQVLDWYPGCGIAVHEPRVVCQWCGETHLGYGDLGPTQGDMCAASVHRRESGDVVVIGHYGSHFDMNVYRWSDFPSWADDMLPIDPICDRCISDLIKKDELELLGEANVNLEKWQLEYPDAIKGAN